VLAAAALAVGLLVGVVSGLTGIGGGVLMVPFLYVLYGRLLVPADAATVLAHATSLAVIVPTAVRGVMGYRNTGLVRWRAALPLAAVSAVSAAITAPLAVRLPGAALRVGFGCFLMVVAADLLLRSRPLSGAPAAGGARYLLAALLGVPVGMLSAALGIGGGIPATMGMYYVLRLPLEALAPTSLAVIMITALGGTGSYLLTTTPAVSFAGVVGHVDFLHGLPLAAGAVLAAPFGVRLNRRLPVTTLRRVFGVLLAAVGVDLIVQNLG
jgi:uncharacterized membrane protein YfcA